MCFPDLHSDMLLSYINRMLAAADLITCIVGITKLCDTILVSIGKTIYSIVERKCGYETQDLMTFIAFI